MTTIGIDNGISGGIVALDEEARIVAMTTMPVQKTRKGNEIDIRELHRWLFDDDDGANAPINAIMCIEEPGGSKSAKAASSMAGSFHAIRGMFETLGEQWHRVTPQRWQKVMLPGVKAGDTKPAALELARRLWPAETWLATPRSRTPDSGLYDAALIARYCWQCYRQGVLP